MCVCLFHGTTRGLGAYYLGILLRLSLPAVNRTATNPIHELESAMTRKTLTGLLLAASTMTAGTLAVVNAQDDDKGAQAAQDQANLEAAIAAALGEAQAQEEKHDHDHTPTSVHSGDKVFNLDDEKAYPDPDGFATMFDRISYAIGRSDGTQIPASQPELDSKTYGEGIKKGLAEENEDYALGYSQGFELARRFLAQREEEVNMEAFVDGIAAALKEEDEGRSIGYLIGNSYREADIVLKADTYLIGVDDSLAVADAPEPKEGEEPKPVETKLTEEQVQETLGAFQAYMAEKQKQDTIKEGQDYIDNLKAYCLKEKVKNSFTGAYEEPDERLMRSIETKIDISDARKDDFRREMMSYIGGLAIDGRTFDYKANERLHRALELKLFEDQKDTIKLTSMVSQVVDKDTQAKIDVVKQRLIDRFGYDDQSATDVLNFVASIFARGDAKQPS